MANLTKHELNRIAQLEEDISSYKRIIKTLKEVKEDFKQELDQYKTAHDKLTAGLKEAVAESIKYKRERDSLIKDVEKLREEKEDLKRLGYETYKDAVKYKKLTEHIRLKALHNPSVSRYKDLMHFIDELEGGFYE